MAQSSDLTRRDLLKTAGAVTARRLRHPEVKAANNQVSSASSAPAAAASTCCATSPGSTTAAASPCATSTSPI